MSYIHSKPIAMFLKKLIITTFFLHFIFCGFTAIQFYEGLLNNGAVTNVALTSHISWGFVDIDFIQLNKIEGSKDGMIKFNIQPTDYVEVSLTKASNLNARFGFIFKSANHFTLQLNGEEEDLGTIGYNSTDEFRVVKCGMLIRFYKNMDLLYEYCDNNSAEDLVHTTHVTTAVNTELFLTFDSDLSNCSSPFFASPNDTEMMLLNSTNIESSEVMLSENTEPTNTSEQLVFSGDKIIIANVFNQEGAPVKQFRIRTTKAGKIPNSHAVYDYMRESYRVEFKENN